MKYCAKGLWNETIPNINFNSDGVSNFCDLQELMMSQYPRGEKGKADWKKIVNTIKSKRGKSKYDCVVGVSGGVDSSFLLVILKSEGLNPLAVNLDNGFNSKIAVQNIFKVTKALDIDLETFVVDYEEMKDILRSYMKASLPWIDAPTDLAIKAVMYKVAIKEGIKYIIRGNDFRSEGKQPKEWTYIDNKQLRFIHKKFGSGIKLKSYPMLSFFTMIYSAFFRRTKDIRPYYYIDYDKDNAKKILSRDYGWTDYGGHHHENLFTKFVMAYWLPKKFNIDKRIINLSAQILSGNISREQGMIQINSPFEDEKALDDLKTYVSKKLGISTDEFQLIWSRKNKDTFDYPSNYNLIIKFSITFSYVIKKVFDYKPMAIIEHEVINQKN